MAFFHGKVKACLLILDTLGDKTIFLRDFELIYKYIFTEHIPR